MNALTNLDSMLKSWSITFLTKVHIVKVMVSPLVMYGCESWTIKKAEHLSTDAFKLWCWRRFLRVPWTARSNQSIIKEINSEHSLERLMLKLKLQNFGHLMRIADSLEKTFGWERLRAGREGDDRGWNSWIGIIYSVDMSLSKLGENEGQGSLECCSPWYHRVGHNLVIKQQQQNHLILERI